MAETFEIKLTIQTEEELYNSFDEERRTLSADVIDYLDQKYQEKELGDSLTVRITSAEPIDEENLRAAFRDYLDTQRLKLKKEQRRNSVKQLWMFAIGVFFIALGLVFADRLPALTGEIISTVGAFSMWEAASIWIVENPGNRLRRKWLDLLSHTKIICETKK